ncbi:hypothetical protein P3T29_005903 [Kitasatospora sp. MAP5-34]|nr:hypothetical protein [Kitasatospora sp. MAP5-34]
MTVDAARRSPRPGFTLPGGPGMRDATMRVLPSRTMESGEPK